MPPSFIYKKKTKQHQQQGSQPKKKTSPLKGAEDIYRLGPSLEKQWWRVNKKKRKSIASQSGYSMTEAKFHVKVDGLGSVIVNASGKGEAKMMVAKQLKKRKDIVSVTRVQAGKAKQVDKKLENVTEGKYHNYRNDESMTPKQKIGRSMMEVRDTLKTLESIVGMNIRLKNEIGVDSTSYWKRTHTAMKKISERLVKLANKVGQLH